MKLNRIGICLSLMLLVAVCPIFAAKAVPSTGTKRLDLSKFHNVGNIWLRVSNYGFFGSGDDVVPQYPSLEYPGGSGTDYLYQGALWFGAKKQRRNQFGKKMFWPVYPPTTVNNTPIPQDHPDWNASMIPVLDTLVTVGFDGDDDLYEFLPAYNPRLAANPDMFAAYEANNPYDGIATASTRFHRRGVDDDGDGKIDEDMVGYTFPFRQSAELPSQFNAFGGMFPYSLPNSAFSVLNEPANLEVWFPLGFQELAFDNYPALYPQNSPLDYLFTTPRDDDGDGRYDEDGAPVSEQDFIAYYYDYCPFGSPGQRDHGQSATRNEHIPLGVRVRQMSYQWSFEYIKNLVYVEFNITNMHKEDELVDCAMGIYMDADVGPQTWGAEKAADDKSGYVKGSGYEFAYTFDADFDGGLSPGYVGARVCTPDPDQLKFHCWYWKVGDGPDDSNPLNLSPTNKTANEKYWLLTGRNPNPNKYTPLRPELDSETEYEQPVANDTRFLFAFYGAQPGTADYNDPDKRWNLAPGKTMKIVVAVFPGDTLADLKETAGWAQIIYGQAQDLISVVKPDLFPHYNPPEPPEIPKLFAEIVDQGTPRIDLYWDNRSEYSQDTMTVPSNVVGWQFPDSPRVPGLDSDPNLYPNWEGIPLEFQPDLTLPPSERYNNQALVNPYTGFRLRHDFQGYSIWGRSGSGSREAWEMVKRWDKEESQDELDDFNVNSNFPDEYKNYGGYLGLDTGLPNKNEWVPTNPGDYTKFYHYNSKFELVPLTAADDFYGFPIYDPDKDYGDPAIALEAQKIDELYPGVDRFQYRQTLKARLFKHSSIRQEIFDELYDPKMIPLGGFGFVSGAVPTADEISALKSKRLSRRYYKSEIIHPPKGIEYYVAVTAYDRGIAWKDVSYLESGRDADANMKVFFPGSVAKEQMDNIMVIPNPYIGSSKFDGRLENDQKGDKSRRLWFVNLPMRCTIRIYTLAGDLVQQLEHDGQTETDIITISKASPYKGMAASGMHHWNLLSRNNQIIAPGVYLFSVENKSNGKVKVGKFVVVK